MAEVSISQAEWENILALYEKYGYRPTIVARKLALPFGIVKQFYHEGTVNGFPPIELVLAERKKAKEEAKKTEIPPVFRSIPLAAVQKLHVDDARTATPIPPHTPVQTHTDPPVPSRAPAAPLPPAPEPSPNVAILAETGDPAKDLMVALDSVHRDLAKGLYRESKLVGGLREQAIGLASGATAAVRAYEVLIKSVTDKILRAVAKDEIEERRAFTLIGRLSKVVKVAADQAKIVIDLQRLLAGLPQSISATVASGAGVGAPVDLTAITASLERLQEQRRSRIIDADAVPYEGEEGGE